MKEKSRTLLNIFGPFFGLFIVFLLFVVLAPPAFHSLYNLKTIVTQTVIIGIGALGMTLVIINAGIDLSVGSVIALATVVIAGVLNIGDGTPGFMHALIAALAAVAVSGFFGFLNGLFSAAFKIVPFIVTLGTMQIARGVAKWLAHEQTVIAPETWLNSLMNVDPEPSWLIFAPGVWILILFTILVSFLLRYTVFGRHVFALGSNEQAARLCGIPITKKRILVYSLCGFFAGLGGIMQFANLTVGDPTVANGAELDIIAAVVIGGGSFDGGEGSAMGSLIGALMMAILRNGCNLVGIPNYVQNIVIGAIIIGAVAIDRLKHGREE